jgi:rod shape-determining protein MreB
MSFFADDVGLTLVDDSFIYNTKTDKGPLVLPAYVAMQKDTKRVLACGEEAKAMQGREPETIVQANVLSEGIIADQDLP